MIRNFQIDGHSLALLHKGAEYFPRLIAAIDAATHSVYIETYIYTRDAIGEAVAEALLRAVRRGVRAHVLLDGYGSSQLSKAWVAGLRHKGLEIQWFRPEISWLTLRRKRLRRLHRKLAVIDERTAFVGGINVADDVPGGDVTEPRLDYAVEMQGAQVAHVHAAMQRLWALVSWVNFRQPRRVEKFYPAHVYTLQQKMQQRVSFLVRDNLRHRRDIEIAYLRAITAAQREIIIANAYFLPGRRLRQTLLDAARRGVRVVLLLQGRVEYRIQHYATLALYDELLGAGVEIHEYHASFLHAKVAVIDEFWSTVGSSNIEPFSLWLAREANLAIQDAGFARALRENLIDEMERGARRLEHETWQKRGLMMRLMTRAGYVMIRLMTAVIGYARGRDDV